MRGISTDITTDRRRVRGDKPWHQFPKASGIYTITHVLSGRKYVGCAVDLRHRVWGHIWAFRKGVHHNPRMQRLWTKEGARAFEFTLHALHADISTLEDAEAALISELDTFNAAVGFNMCKRAVSAIGRKWNPEQRAKMTKWTPEIIAGWLAERAAGVTLRDISKRTGVCISNIAKMTRRAGYKARKRAVITDAARSLFRTRYKDGASIKQISREFNIDPKCVSSAVSDLMSTERSRHDHLRAIPNRVKGADIASMTMMYLAGKNFNQIGAELGRSPATVKLYLFQGITPPTKEDRLKMVSHG